MNTLSLTALDQKVLDCAERWGHSGKGTSYNPILSPLLLKIFRNQIQNPTEADSKLRDLVDICQKKDLEFNKNLKIAMVFLSVFFVASGIYTYRKAQRAAKQGVQSHSNARYMEKSSPK